MSTSEWNKVLSRRQVLAGLLAGVSGLSAFANPQGMTVGSGTVSAVQTGSRLDITTSQNAVINWQSFNIGAGQNTTFHQPSPVSVVWNRILDANPSQIWGSLNANGIVVLMNQSGFYFGPNSSINVGGFIATTVPISTASPLGTGMWQFQGAPPTASIINYGQIRTQVGGSLFLVSEKIENHGLLSAPDGTLGLYAGKEVLISERPDGRGLSASVQLPAGSIDNTGSIIADAGTIALHAQVVNQNGLVQAESVREHNGAIELIAGDAVNLGPNSVLVAKGGDQSVSQGGRITIQSAQSFSDAAGSLIDVSGGAQGGNGGSVEVSAVNMPGVHSRINGTAQRGWLGGSLLFDPYDITLGSDGPDSPDATGTIGAASAPGASLQLNVSSAFAGFAQIRLQAMHDITLESGTVWNLNGSTGVSDPGSLLRLEAGQDIIIQNNAQLVAGPGWTVQLAAGVQFSAFNPRDFSLAADFAKVPLAAGTGGIYLNNGSGSIETSDGDINLRAGHEVLVGSGFIHTVGGGNITIATGDGDVDSGTDASGYLFSKRGYTVPSLGGIGTAAGGNVSIDAGGNIFSFGATIGAFGAGDVNLGAGENILGSFMLCHGTGTLHAGGDVGSFGSPVTLGLIGGGWNVAAGWNAAASQVVAGQGDLYLNEVYNPNGALNSNRVLFGARVPYQYDYAADAYVNLMAGNSVQLLGNALVTPVGSGVSRIPIYPPILDITAGAGGVVLANDVVLYPSAQGNLHITTTDGGGLQSQTGGYYDLIVSDSGSPDYTTFRTDHASTPVHLLSTGYAVDLDISGDVKNVFVNSPGQADMTIHGNAVNFTCQVQNLSDADKSFLNIDGDYSIHSDHTFETLAAGADLSIFTDPIKGFDPDNIASRLTYNSATKQLGIQGIMTQADLDALLHPMVYKLDSNSGTRVIDQSGNYVMAPAVLTTDTAGLARLFKDSQDVPPGSYANNGIQVGGPGTFSMSAHNLDLGVSDGIRSVGPMNNPALASFFTHGANLNLDLSGDLLMTSSQIASFNGGGINITAQGKMDIGSESSLTSDDTPKGIYTAEGGAVSVHAVGDVNVSGSRIASYDGGDVTVISDQGNVDAGQGAKGFFYVSTPAVDPVTGLPILDPTTGLPTTRNDRFFGSGIMAVTRTDSQARVGDITVTTTPGGGSILANDGGILQLAFNTADQRKAKVTLDAGGDIKANQSGVLGGNVKLTAKGSIEGLIVANQNLDIKADQNVNVTAVASGSASVSAGDKVSGSIVGAGSVNVAGNEVSATVISTSGNASTSGDASGSKVGAFNGVAAPTAQQTVESTDKTMAKNTTSDDESDEQKKKKIAAPAPVLARSVGRVTVILPKH